MRDPILEQVQKNDESLTVLELCGNYTSERFNRFMEALKANTTITQFFISSISFTDRAEKTLTTQDIKKIAEIFKTNKTIFALAFFYNNLTSDLVREILSILNSTHTLSRLKIKGDDQELNGYNIEDKYVHDIVKKNGIILEMHIGNKGYAHDNGDKFQEQKETISSLIREQQDTVKYAYDKKLLATTKDIESFKAQLNLWNTQVLSIDKLDWLKEYTTRNKEQIAQADREAAQAALNSTPPAAQTSFLKNYTFLALAGVCTLAAIAICMKPEILSKSLKWVTSLFLNQNSSEIESNTLHP